MNQIFGYALAVLIVGAAIAIFVVRITRFIKTKGRSACGNCPYSGQCSGSCAEEDKRS